MSTMSKSKLTITSEPTPELTSDPTNPILIFTEASGRIHALDASKLARVELYDTRVKTFIPDELEVYDFDTPEQAKEIFVRLSELMTQFSTTH